jgi:hypothetical protein
MNNAKMFDIVVNKMYTNKPGAVIRELSANAWDSHRNAGNESTPFDIQLPSWLDKTFSIRDYGTGIPHDQFESIYTTVGASTKDGTNEFIGSFGLGSKVPFTMTDTFCVENWHGGIKTTWVCFKSAGVPQVSKVDECPSDEPSGLKVSFTFDTDEVREFTRQITEQLKFFPVKPNVTGGDGHIHFIPLPDDWETRDYFFTQEKQYSWERKSYVVMGNVCYHLNTAPFDHKYYYIFSNGVTIKAPIGAVDIPPSREHLEMTPRTMAYITSVLDRVLGEYEEETKARLDATQTLLEAMKVMATTNKDLLSRSFKDALSYHGVGYATLCSRKVYELANNHVYSLELYRGEYKYRYAGIPIQDILDDKAVILMNDLWTGHKNHIETNAATLRSTYQGKNIYFVHLEAVHKKDRAQALATALTDVTAVYGVTPALLSSVIGMVPVKAKGTVVRAEANQFYKLNGEFNLGRSFTQSSVEVTGDVPTDGYYLEVTGHSVVDPDSKITGLRLLGLLSQGLAKQLDKPVYFVRSKSVSTAPKLIRLDSKVLDSIRDKVTSEAAKQHKLLRARFNIHRVPKEQADVLKNVKNKQLKVYIRYASYITSATEGCNREIVSLCTSMYSDWKEPEYTPPKKLAKLTDMYCDVADLFSCMNTYSEERRKTRLNTLKLIANI